MDLQQQLRAQLTSCVERDGVPKQVYALVGAGMLLRQRIVGLPQQANGAWAGVRRSRDHATTTAYQIGFEARERTAALPGEVATFLRDQADRVRGLPAGVLHDAAERVIDVRDGAAWHYEGLAASGERALVQWHAERLLNQRAERLTRSVTPKAAKAAVSTRSAARRAAASPTGVRTRRAGRRAADSARRTWDEYIAAIDEAGERQWGDPLLLPTVVPMM